MKAKDFCFVDKIFRREAIKDISLIQRRWRTIEYSHDRNVDKTFLRENELEPQ